MTAPRGFAGTLKPANTKARCVQFVRVSFDDQRRCILDLRHSGPCAPEPTDRELFHGPLPSSGSATSAAAAQLAAPAAGIQRQAVLEALATGDKTDEEIQTATGLDGDAERPRRWQLCRDHLVRDSGRMRKTTSGAWAVVWELVS